MFACMLPIAVILRTIPFDKSIANGPVPSSGVAAVALVMMNVMAYNLSWGPLPWAFVPEVSKSAGPLTSKTTELTNPDLPKPDEGDGNGDLFDGALVRYMQS